MLIKIYTNRMGAPDNASYSVSLTLQKKKCVITYTQSSECVINYKYILYPNALSIPCFLPLPFFLLRPCTPPPPPRCFRSNWCL